MTPAPPDLLRGWAADTWASLVAATYERTGLPADSLDDLLSPGSRAPHTSPTNVAGLLWSAVAAAELRLCPRAEALDRCARALATLAEAPRHAGSGLFYNWYDARDGGLMATWGRGGRRLDPFVSSIDNAWLALALDLVGRALPEVGEAAGRVRAPMRLDACYDAAARPAGGLMRGGFWGRAHRGRSTPARFQGERLHVTRHHYALANSETRLATYVSLLDGRVGPQAASALEAPVRTYRGHEVYASLGGGMFEALAVDMFVPEELWAPDTWGRSHAATVAAQREFALGELGWPAWGLSPCACPGRGYAEFGVPALGILGDGYRTTWRGQGVLTPHASAMALQYDADAALANLRRLQELGCHGPGGFVDAIGVRTILTARRYLTLDQSFVMAAFANHLAGDVMRRLACPPAVEAVLRPIVATTPAARPRTEGAE